MCGEIILRSGQRKRARALLEQFVRSFSFSLSLTVYHIYIYSARECHTAVKESHQMERGKKKPTGPIVCPRHFSERSSTACVQPYSGCSHTHTHTHTHTQCARARFFISFTRVPFSFSLYPPRPAFRSAEIRCCLSFLFRTLCWRAYIYVSESSSVAGWRGEVHC